MLSIIIPMYNVEDKICRTIDSIIKQNVEEYELIIIDDYSKDNSYNICKRYIEDKKIENAIILKNEENHGPSYTRNRGITQAIGDYCVMIDSDDYLEENALNSMLDNMTINGLVTIGMKCIYKNKTEFTLSYGEKNKIINIQKKEFIKFYLAGLLNSPANKMYDLDIIRKNKILFNENSSYGEDLEFNLKYIKNIENIIFINKPLYIYMREDTGLNNSYKENELIIAKINFENKLKIFKDDYELTDEDEKKMYNEYLKERIKLYYKYKKYDKRNDKKQYLNEIIKSDNILEILNKTALKSLHRKILGKIINFKLFFLARVYLQLFL